MSKLHPWDKYTAIQTGDTVRATGTVDRRWPTTVHSAVEMTGKCIEMSSNKLAFELTDPKTSMKTEAQVEFSWEDSEPTPTDGVKNTCKATGSFGFLTFSFEDDQVEFEEKDGGSLEIIADGKLDVTGPLDLQARSTIEVWKAGDITRIRFTALRKNGKCLGKGELSLKVGSTATA